MKRFHRYSTNASGSTTDPSVDRWVRSAYRTESLDQILISGCLDTGPHNLAVLSHKEVARLIGMTTEGVKRVEQRALRKLRWAFRKEIEEWMDDTGQVPEPAPAPSLPRYVYVPPEPEPVTVERSSLDVAWERFCLWDDQQKQMAVDSKA